MLTRVFEHLAKNRGKCAKMLIESKNSAQIELRTLPRVLVNAEGVVQHSTGLRRRMSVMGFPQWRRGFRMALMNVPFGIQTLRNPYGALTGFVVGVVWATQGIRLRRKPWAVLRNSFGVRRAAARRKSSFRIPSPPSSCIADLAQRRG